MAADARTGRRARSHRWAWAVLALLCLVPMARGSMLLAQPYGDSHDGRNGATWAAAAEALRSDPIESRLGAIRLDGSVYANHPPAIAAVVAGAEVLGGDRPGSDRAAMVAGLWAAMALSFLLLRELGFARWTALVGPAAIAVAPMTRAYASMVDTPMLGLPFALGVLLAAARIRSTGTLPAWGVAVLTVGPLVSWQLVLLEALLLLWLAIDASVRPALRRALPAVAVGIAMLVLWLVWVHGSLGPALEQARSRSGAAEGTSAVLGDAVETQWSALRSFLGPLLMTLPFALVGCWAEDRGRRVVNRLALPSVGAYALLTADGAAVHDYWSYWVLIPVAIGAALAAEYLVRLVRTSGFPPIVRRSVPVALVGFVLLISFARSTTHERVHPTSAAAGAVLAAVDLPTGQDELWLLAEFGPDDAWVVAHGIPAAHLTPARYDAAMGRGATDHLALISTSCTAAVLACDRIPGEATPYPDRQFRIVRLGQLVEPHVRADRGPSPATP